MKRNSTFAGRFALTGVAAAALCLAVPSAWSLGLGRLQVQSALGESLRAEIDVTSITPEEASNLRVRIAPPESYRTAGVEYNAVLPGSEITLQRRADGRPYLRITSDRGVQEPFIDVILEITWSTGRLVREYTLLFDPPNTARNNAQSQTVPVAPPAPATSPIIAAAPVPPIESAPPAVERRARTRPQPTESAAAPAPVPRAAHVATAPPPAAGEDAYKVRAGDSLSRIASRTQRQGVSLDQMLVALFRSNPDAFVDNNMNRLRSGVVLTVPSTDAAKGVSPAEARQVIQAQSADFGAYRQRLAGNVPAAKTEGTNRQASGKVQASVTDRQQNAATTPDKLTLSKGATPEKSAEEQRISREREKKASDIRVAELAKNVDELKKLQSAASSAPAVAPAAPKPVPAAAPTPAPVVAVAPPPPVPAPPAPVPPPPLPPPPAPVPAPPPPVPVAVASAPASSVAPAVAVVAPSAMLASAATAAPKPPAPVTAAASKPATTPAPEPSNEPGMLGSLLDDNPIALGIGALALLLIGGYAAYRFSKRRKTDSGETSFLESRLQPDSFFGASGGQRIDTREAGGASSSMSYSLSQLDAIGDVDPVAEADVYLAYGRDLQAEEILKEAMRSNPERMAIRTKLLEVYAKRRDTKGFELLATQLFALTHGVGEDWAKAQELGQQVDPENPLYRPGGEPLLAHGEAGQIIEPLGASTMPQSVLPTPSQFNAAAADENDMGLDLDLGDPDVGSPTSPSPLEVTQAFRPEPRLPETRLPETRAPEDDAMSLDFTMPDLGVPETPSVPAYSSAPTTIRIDQPEHFDLSDISLDLDVPQQPMSPNEITAPSPPPQSAFGNLELPDLELDDGSDPLARKLELAEEFRQIGDTDGARDLLQEVIANATGATKTRAQGMLADLG